MSINRYHIMILAAMQGKPKAINIWERNESVYEADLINSAVLNYKG